MNAPIPSTLRITCGAGGAPAVMMVSPDRSAVAASGEEYSMVSTVGAAHMLVTPCSSMSRKIWEASTRRRHRCVAPTAVTPHVWHQPLQWNIGSVQR